MITAVDALNLPVAKLNDEQVARLKALETEIENHIRQNMERRGCEFETSETDGNVIAEMNQRLKAAGFLPQWVQRQKGHKFNSAIMTTTFLLALAPSDEAYQQVPFRPLS